MNGCCDASSGPMDRLTRCIYGTKFYYPLEAVNYSLLRLCKFLPVSMSEAVARTRGNLRYFLDLDWKSTSLGYPFVRENTEKAMGLISSSGCTHSSVRERFVHQSREELEGILCSLPVGRWPQKVEFENIHFVEEVREKGHGLILLTAHFDSSISGSIFLADLGYTVNLFYDDVVYDKAVPFFLRSFFHDKYAAMRRRFNDGDMISRDNLMEVHRRLRKGEILVWLYDILLSRPGTIEVEFLRRRYAAPDSVVKMALQTNSYLGAYLTQWLGNGRYRTSFMKPVLPSENANPNSFIREYYAFLSDFITASPERWWIADALINFKEVGSCP
jgi:lauroyl/myristoyl acyltransferase